MPRAFRLGNPPRRRTSAASSSSSGYSVEDIQRLLMRSMVLNVSGQTFQMTEAAQREELAHLVWTTTGLVGEDCACASNPDLFALLSLLVQNPNLPPRYDHAEHQRRRTLQIEGILTGLMRTRSQKLMGLLTARMSIAALQSQIPRDMWQLLRSVAAGVLVSHDAAESFIDYALQFRPECPYEAIEGVAASVFDNYSRKVKYSSKVTVDSGGYLLNMTNSADFCIPKSLKPPGFDADQLCALPLRLAHLLTPLTLSCVLLGRVFAFPTNFDVSVLRAVLTV